MIYPKTAQRKYETFGIRGTLQHLQGGATFPKRAHRRTLILPYPFELHDAGRECLLLLIMKKTKSARPG